MNYAILPLYIFFGILPSLIWLLYYLKKDLHPEPRKMIFNIFILGSIITIPTFFTQLGLVSALQQLQIPSLYIDLIKWFLVIALTEELFKYIVVKMSVLNSYVVDEPLDIMLYMVVGSLGFSAVENVLYLLPLDGTSNILQATVMVSCIRFIGATFLHSLCSALLGYFLALASLKNKKRLSLTVVGLVLATVFHGLYDFSISIFQGSLQIIIPIIIILSLALFMIYDFNEIKKIKSICKI